MRRLTLFTGAACLGLAIIAALTAQRVHATGRLVGAVISGLI